MVEWLILQFFNSLHDPGDEYVWLFVDALAHWCEKLFWYICDKVLELLLESILFYLDSSQFLFQKRLRILHLTQLNELIIIGTGKRQRFPKPELLKTLIEAKIGFEVMDSQAACRTYNILVGEGRQVLLALIVEAT